MFRNSMNLKFALLMLLLVVAAMLVGVEPWGPG
jgi:hypothetical protein